MIWARPLTWDGELQSLPMLARSGLSTGERALVVSGIEGVAVVTGLDADARELLAHTVGAGWLGGTNDAAIVRFSAAQLNELKPNAQLFQAFERFLGRAMQPSLTLGSKRFTWGERTYVMGIVNVTPDSFSGDGQTAHEGALAHAQAQVAAGADLLDIGGESTRPGAAPVDEAEELRRVVPLIEALKQRLPAVPLSVDTSKAVVARRAVEAGAVLINDISGFRDPAMLATIAELKVPAVAMHMQGSPSTMQHAPSYDDVMAEVLDALEGQLQRAEAAGVPRSMLLVDPGIGFGKTVEHNLFLLRHLSDLRLLNAPVLLGTSRKGFLGQLIGGKAPAERVVASAATVAIAAAQGSADLVRVHDVAQTKEALAVADALSRARGGGRHFDA